MGTPARTDAPPPAGGGVVVDLPPRPPSGLPDPFREGRRISRIGIWLLLLAFAALAAWAAFAPLQGAIVMPGQVRVDSHRKKVRHLEGGIVKEILVRAGDRVTKGQPLIILEDVDQRALVKVLGKQLDSLRIRAARLRAERERRERFELPPDLRSRAGDPDIAAIVEAETALFQAQRKLLSGQTGLIRAEIDQARDEIAGLRSQLASIDRNIANLREELELNQVVYKKGFLPYTKILALRRAVAQKQERRGATVAQIARTRQRISELELRILGLYDSYAKKAADRLKDVEARIASLEERLRPARDALTRRVITAPIGGEVVSLQVHTPGVAVAPYQDLMEIVPEGAKLIVEGRIRPEDIDEVGTGKAAEIRFSAYKQRTTPTVAGRVVYVSADALSEETPRGTVPYYLVRVEIDPESLARAGNLTLTPGMTATVFIKTRARTALQYLLDPVTETLDRALRES